MVLRSQCLLAVMTVGCFLVNTATAQLEHFHPKGKPPSKHTIKKLEEARKTLPFADKRDFEEQKRGFIAAPNSKKIMADAGHVAWDLDRFQFLLEGDEFDSIHPSLVRQSVLNMNFGLYEVIPGIYQVRGFDLSNITFIKGETGWIVFDPMTALETARGIKTELLEILEGMDYCLDWRSDPSEWSVRDLVYHVLDTPPDGVHSLIRGIVSGEITEYDLWSDRTNMTPERAAYDMDQLRADVAAFGDGLVASLAATPEEDLEGKTVMMHQKTRGVDEVRTLQTVVERSLNGHLREHLTQLREIRASLGF